MNKRIKKKILKRRLATGWTPSVIQPKDTVLHLTKPFHPGNMINVAMPEVEAFGADINMVFPDMRTTVTVEPIKHHHGITSVGDFDNEVYLTPIMARDSFIKTHDDWKLAGNIEPGDEVTSCDGHHYLVKEIVSMTKALEDTE